MSVLSTDDVLRERSGLVVECLIRDPGAAGRASPASLLVALEQDTLILA